MNIEEETLIKYIKSKYPKIIFNPVKLNSSDLLLKSYSLGFIVSENKLILGYINNSGELCKLIEPVDLSNLSHSKFIEIISKLPIVDSDNKNTLVNLLDDKDVISKSEHNSIMEDMKKLLALKESEYNILVNSDMDGNIEDQILIKKEYESKMNEIKIKYDDDIYKLKEEIRKSDENKDICKTRLLNEKDIIINGIKDFKNRMTEYISQIYKEQKEKGDSNKLNELYMNLQNEKAQVENNMNILTEREKEHLQKIENDKSVISDYEGKLNLKSDEIANLNNVIKDIQKELNKVQDQFSQAELEKTILAQFKKSCIEMILNEKEQIIDKIKEYNLEWLKWVDNNNVNVRHQKEDLKNDLNIIFTNLKKVINSKNEYLSSLDLSLKDKDKVESQLNLNISDIKAQIKNSLNEQITQLSSKNQDLETEISKESEIIKNKDAVIKELKIKLEDVKKLLEKNESTPIVKTVDYNNCIEIFQKFININNMFFRKKQVLNILDDIISSDNVSTFTHLNDDIKNNIKSKYHIVKDEILKHIDFLDLNKYINDPNITLFKNKDTKHISPAFCDELNTISDYWDNNLGLFREQDRLLTNIYEDLSGAVRVYIRIKPNDKTTKTVYIEGKNKKVVVDCSEVVNVNKKETFGEFYGVFDTQFSNKDVYTGIEKSGNPVDLKIDLSQIVEDNATVSPGLYSAFQQVEDGYSIVLFGYGLSGSGKTFSLLGQNGMPGILHFGLANLQGVQQIKLKYLFEQYINKFTPTLKLITGKIINLINHVPLGGGNDETKEFATHLSSTTSINTNKLKVDDINKITDSLEKYRIEHSRVKKTPNNPVSSRSHLYMVFEIIFENGKIGYITIVDTAGRESPKDIYNLFIDTTIKRAPTFTTILGPTGGPGVISQYIKEEYKEKYDPNDIYAILKEGVYINETINHLIYFFNKKNNKPNMRIKFQDTLDKYGNDKFYVSPEDAEQQINANNNCYMIPILKFLDNLSNRKQDAKDFKPTKFIVLLCVRSEEAYCNQIFSSLEFGNKVKSS